MYQIVSENITKFKIPRKKTAIINSLGYHDSVTYPGQLFRSIINASDDRNALMDEVKSKGQSLDYCSVFETQSYGLPADGIIHSITPIRYYDDNNLFLLEKTYRNIIALLKKERYEVVLIPFIGTGANGYSNIEVFTKLTSLCSKLSGNYPNIHFLIDIYYEERESVKNGVEIEREMHYEQLRNIDIINRNTPRFNRAEIKQHRPKNPFSLEDLNIDSNTNFTDLIEQYIEKNFFPDQDKTLTRIKKEKWGEIFSNLGTAAVQLEDEPDDTLLATIGDRADYDVSSRKKELWRNNYRKRMDSSVGRDWVPPQKTELLIIAYSLGMSKHDTFFLYRFCGYYLNEWNRVDIAIKNCIHYIEDEGGLLLIIIYFFKQVGFSLYKESTRATKE